MGLGSGHGTIQKVLAAHPCCGTTCSNPGSEPQALASHREVADEVPYERDKLHD